MQTALDAYYTALKDYDRVGAAHETAVRSAMQNLLAEAGREKGWTLVPERALPNGKRPDGTFVDEFRIPFGYWEAKDTRDDLRDEVRKKFALGYLLSSELSGIDSSELFGLSPLRSQTMNLLACHNAPA